MRQPPTPDEWAIIRAEYESSPPNLSNIKALADRWGVTVYAINQKAQHERWGKAAQAPRVSSPERNEYVGTVVAAANLMALHPSDQARLNIPTVIERAIAANREDLTSKHKAKLGQLRGIVEGMAQELILQQLSDEELETMGRYIDSLREGEGEDTKAMPSARALKKLLTLESRADTLSKLVQSMGKLVALERVVFGLDGEDKSKEPSTPSTNDSARRIAYLLGKAEG